MSSTGVIVWGRADQQALIREALRAADLKAVAAGSDRSADGAELAKALGVERVADFRHAVTMADDHTLLGLFGPEPLDEDERKLLLDSGRRVVTCEPQFGALADLAAAPENGQAMMFVPLMRRSPGFRAAADGMPQFGAVQCVNIFCRSGLGQGTLYARLFDAMDVLNTLCGQPETMNAASAGPLPEVPDLLNRLRGHMTINMRFKPNRCACVALSDSAGSWFRGVTVLGEGGCLRISDGGFEWIGHDGRIVDQHREEDVLSTGGLIGMQIARALEALDQAEPPPNVVSLMSLCEAARLSCLTGQDEAPAKLVDMLSRP